MFAILLLFGFGIIVRGYSVNEVMPAWYANSVLDCLVIFTCFLAGKFSHEMSKIKFVNYLAAIFVLFFAPTVIYYLQMMLPELSIHLKKDKIIVNIIAVLFIAYPLCTFVEYFIYRFKQNNSES